MKSFLVLLVDKTTKHIVVEMTVEDNFEWNAKHEALLYFTKLCKYTPRLKNITEYDLEICEL